MSEDQASGGQHRSRVPSNGGPPPGRGLTLSEDHKESSGPSTRRSRKRQTVKQGPPCFKKKGWAHPPSDPSKACSVLRELAHPKFHSTDRLDHMEAGGAEIDSWNGTEILGKIKTHSSRHPHTL